MHRKLPALISVLVLIAILCHVPALATAANTYNSETPQYLTSDQLYSEAAILMDGTTGDILYSKNANVRMYPASTTKILTLLLAVESGIDLDREITIPQAAADITTDSSIIPVFPGEHMTFRDLLIGTMVQSGNDGANAIAVIVAGSVDAFVAKMNQRAAEIGCTNTHFANAHGLHDSNHYSTAYDLALITKTAMQSEAFREIAASTATTIYVKERGNITLTPRNYLLLKTSKYYYEECIGVKTGYHSKAGKCFVGAAEKEGALLISVALNSASDDEKFLDTIHLFDYGWTCYDTYTLDQIYNVARAYMDDVVISNAAKDDPYGGVLTLDIAQISDSSYIRMVEKNSESALSIAVSDFSSRCSIEITHDLTAPISVGEIIGNFSYQEKGSGQLVTAKLVASRDVAEYIPETTMTDIFPFLRIFENQVFRLLLIVLAILIVLIIILVLRNRAAKQRRRRRIYEQRRREYMRRQQMQGQRPGNSYPQQRRTTYSGSTQRRPSSTGNNRRSPY